LRLRLTARLSVCRSSTCSLRPRGQLAGREHSWAKAARPAGEGRQGQRGVRRAAQGTGVSKDP
jgi:hypothetical protein